MLLTQYHICIIRFALYFWLTTISTSLDIFLFTHASRVLLVHFSFNVFEKYLILEIGDFWKYRIIIVFYNCVILFFNARVHQFLSIESPSGFYNHCGYCTPHVVSIKCVNMKILLSWNKRESYSLYKQLSVCGKRICWKEEDNRDKSWKYKKKKKLKVPIIDFIVDIILSFVQQPMVVLIVCLLLRKWCCYGQ